MIGKNIFEILRLDQSILSIPQDFKNKIAVGQAIHFEINHSKVSENPRWLCIDFQPFRKAQNNSGELIIFIQDITARKIAEKGLQESHIRLMENLNGTPLLAVQWLNEDGKVVFWNPASEKLFGWLLLKH